MREFYVVFARKIIKMLNFYDTCPKINNIAERILQDICTKNVQILHDNCLKNFPDFFLGGGGTCPSDPLPSPTPPMLMNTYRHMQTFKGHSQTLSYVG